MRVICELSLTMSEKDENGLHHVRDRYCGEESGPCFSFDCTGQVAGSCSRFRRLPTGVKVCVEKN